MSQDTHEHEGGCCCPSDPVAIDRNFANAIRGRSQGFLNKEGLAVARAMLAASRSILEFRGGVTGEDGVWLLTAEAHLPAIEEKHGDALPIFQQALTLAQAQLGDDHYATGVCSLNVGDTLLHIKLITDAVPYFERAKTVLNGAIDKLNEDTEHLREFLTGARDEAERLLKQARAQLGGE